MRSRKIGSEAGLMVTAAALLAISGSTHAQVQTGESTGRATQEISVQRAEVVRVDGNDLVVKLADGTLHHFPNVPASARVKIDGRQVGVHDLKPGMILERTITTTTTPRTITTVQNLTGTVWHVNPPNSVILTLEDGKNQSFKIPEGQKFKVNDQMVVAFGLKKGMKVYVARIVEVPETVVSQHVVLPLILLDDPSPKISTSRRESALRPQFKIPLSVLS
jgi:hypothetical protein